MAHSLEENQHRDEAAAALQTLLKHSCAARFKPEELIQCLCMHTLTLFSCAWCAYATNWIKLDWAAHLMLFAPGTEWGLCVQNCECGRFFVDIIFVCVHADHNLWARAAACSDRRALRCFLHQHPGGSMELHFPIGEKRCKRALLALVNIERW